MKKLISVILLMTLLFTSIIFPKQIQAASGEQVIKTLDFDPAIVIFDGKPSSNEVITSKKSINFGDIDVNIPGVTRVELRDMNNKLIKVLQKSSGNKFSIGTENGKPMEVKRENVEVPRGYFAWFRDPNKVVWMFDFDGRHHRSTRPYVYDTPPAKSCKEATGPHAKEETGVIVPKCNEAWDYRSGTLNVSTMTITETNDEVPIKKVDDLQFDKNFTFVENGTLKSGNIKDLKTVYIDKDTLTYRFNFLTEFVGKPDYTEVSGQNLVVQWYNQWELNVVGKVYKYPKMKVVAITGDNPGGGDPPGESSCYYTISGPTKGTSINAAVMSPSANGVIRSDPRGNEQFDVLQGIPNSENLYANAFGMDYLFQHEFVNNTGSYTYTVNVKKTYELTWTEKTENPPGKDGKPVPPTETPMSETEVVEKQYQVTRDFSYWTIDNLEVYGIEKATMENYALPGGSVTLYPSGYTPPSADAGNSDNLEEHVTPAPCEDVDLGTESRDGGDKRPSVPNEDFTSEAEGAVGENKVKNDRVIFNGSTIMDNSEAETSAPTPSTIPQPSEIDNNVLYSSGNTISNTLINEANTPSSGTIYYNLVLGIKGGSPKDYPINGINTVTVHTPVVNYSSISDDRAHNQKINPALDRSAVILDRPFVVTIPTSGQHLNIPGYGNRDYDKYIRNKQVWFPFDVYNADKSIFYPKEQWIDIPITQIDTTFNLPVWVDEGFYDALFRTIAENAPSPFTSQPDANTNLIHHVATDVVKVDVIGRLYDFRITDIADYNWETVFRTNSKSSEPTGAAYYVGEKDIDGAPRGNYAPYLLPVRPGSHPSQGYKNVSIKTGYQFSFDLRTKGNMFGPGDAIRIIPSFYFVNKDGSNRQPVDLYYHSNDKRFVKIGSPDATEKRQFILNTRLRNVPINDIQNTAMYLYDHDSSSNPVSGFNRNQFMENYIKKTTKPTWIGKYSWLILPHQVRVFNGIMNAPVGVDQQRKLAAEQMWYGEYSLPAAVYVVKQGTNIAEYGRTHNGLNEKSPIFLKDGYIIVRFNIETIRDQNLSQPYLRYYPLHSDLYPFNNQWQMEGFQRMIQDPYGNRFDLMDGDIVFYHGDLSSYDDFNSNVTH